MSQGWGASEPMSFLALQGWAELGALSGPRDERISHRTTPTALEALHWILEGHACLDLGSASERPTSSLSLLLSTFPHRRVGGLCADTTRVRQAPRAGRPVPKTYRSWLWCWVSARDPEP